MRLYLARILVKSIGVGTLIHDGVVAISKSLVSLQPHYHNAGLGIGDPSDHLIIGNLLSPIIADEKSIMKIGFKLECPVSHCI